MSIKTTSVAELTQKRSHKRKRELFANDRLLIGNYDLKNGPDGFRLRAEARDPFLSATATDYIRQAVTNSRNSDNTPL